MHEALLTELRTALGDRFALERQIGNGVYGTVFLARDPHGRAVALKVLNPDLIDEANRSRMLRELSVFSRFNHPHVLPVLEAGEAAGLLYYSTPFVDGGSLRDRIRDAPLPLGETLRIAREVAEGLEYVHRNGILHRDVTPQNILFDSGRALLKEYWIARAVSRALGEKLERHGVSLGTPGYMSPEQLLGARVDARSDVYSLAILIVLMLTGDLPFDGPTPMAVVERQLAGSGLSRRDLPASIPTGVADAILGALARSPSDRYDTPLELVEACVDGAIQQPALSRQTSVMHPRRWLSWKSFGVGVAVAVMLAAALVVNASRQPGAVRPLAPSLLYTLGVLGSVLLVAGAIRYRQVSQRASPIRGVARQATPDPADRVRSALQYQYDIGSQLGEGGMAVVYTARDLRYRDRTVALKILRPEYAASITSKRFLEEIEIAAQLTHPGIVPLFDSGDADGRPFYVMPCIEGETLKSRIERDGPVPLGDALSVTRDVARALDYAHRRQIVHRDIKPANILLHEGRATLADFGIALALDRSRERVTSVDQSVGTPEYMSPEQFWDTAHIDHRSDLYSLGCVLYQMLDGKPPYSGTVSELAAKHLTAAIPRIRSSRPDVPETIEVAICTALAKNPADRFDSAASLITALS